MRKYLWGTALIALLLAGCTPLPLTPEDIQARKFESVPDKAAIYIVRATKDSKQVGSLLLDDTGPISTYRNAYYRWEVAPGKHRIAGFAGENAVITLDTEPGKLYFVEHTVMGGWKTGVTFTFLNRIDEQRGRSMVLNSLSN